jgi:putative addiction module killer protein
MSVDAEAIEVRKTRTFDVWFRRLADRRAKERIVARLRNLTINQFGDVRSLGGGLFELRIDLGPGYRIYAARCAATCVIVLCAGDKRRQQADIDRARRMWSEWADKHGA